MQFYTQDELEKVDTLSREDIDHCFVYLVKLIIHGRGYEARDYCNTLSQVVQNSLKVNNPTVEKITEVEVQVIATPRPENFKVETFFAWSAYPETCYFCTKPIPARKVGKGIFADHRMVHKWCEECATEEHKKHPNYLKYKK